MRNNLLLLVGSQGTHSEGGSYKTFPFINRSRKDVLDGCKYNAILRLEKNKNKSL